MSEQAKICFNGSLILPVTPDSFEVGAGIKIETVNIHALGDLRIAGYPTLDNITISGFSLRGDIVLQSQMTYSPIRWSPSSKHGQRHAR